MELTTVESLLMNDGFLAWYHLSDDRHVRQWDAWIAENEEHRRLAREAVRMLEYFQYRPTTPETQRKADQIWRRIERQIAVRQVSPPKAPSGALMFSSYAKVAIRNLRRGKLYSLINIAGLSVGMTVAVLIGLWITDELSANTYHANHARTALVMNNYTKAGETGTGGATPIPLVAELRNNYGDNFKRIGDMTFPGGGHTLAVGENRFTEPGSFMEPVVAEILALKMVRGSTSGLNDPHSILLSESTADKLFGDLEPVGRMIKMDNNNELMFKVAGVYQDLPDNCDYKEMAFVAPWQLFITHWDWIKPALDNWGWTSSAAIAEIADNTDFATVNARIKNAVMKAHRPDDKALTITTFLFPMDRWHLYSEFKDGISTGGQITFVWLFGIIGVFVLLLACINFMNLSTARSEKRAREVGIRKVMGSLRGQLVQQFLSESILIALLSFVLSIVLSQLTMGLFNGISGKHLGMPWDNGWFWLLGLLFTVLTGVIAGSYPALFLSSFKPVKVLKGTFKVGRFASSPRKILVVFQFTISVLLINGTIIVFREIRYAKDRPAGYQRSGLISYQETTPEVYTNYNIIHTELLQSGGAIGMAESQCPITDIWAGSGGWDWPGKQPGQNDGFHDVAVRHEFGQTVGWQIKEGRDFSKAFPTDSSAVILNEAAVKYMKLQHPVGQFLHQNGRPLKIVGVVKDMIQLSPYSAVTPVIYDILHEGGNYLNIRLNPLLSTGEALRRIEAVFKKYNPGAPFSYSFADQDYAKKFGDEVRLGDLALLFALLAIFISALGVFGLASFVAEQRTKEICIRKVLGASLLAIWQLLSKEFAFLVALSLLVATPLAYYLMGRWLHRYDYRAGMPWWIFTGAGAGAIVLTLATVSYQSIKAGLLSPSKSLRSE
ncbi:MAG TPA: FtsX-like permease family protein [Dinghuibacter sp.]|uniref:ABC transporter permease n=1 Tax=Dinghuibacter sp. TaxID=2024697 RepID=UPI002C26829E|nr:FtsX-like permease family protein [Dinghuibacter sp.]HTJ14683.1 FtsX-like permease family protein [Dinghuibacter sp.]